jgi:hypothetical protein
MRLGHPQGVFAGGGDISRVPLFDQAPAKETRHLEFVLDNQDSHS